MKPHSSGIHLLRGLSGSVDLSVSLTFSASLPPFIEHALGLVLYVYSLVSPDTMSRSYYPTTGVSSEPFPSFMVMRRDNFRVRPGFDSWHCYL